MTGNFFISILSPPEVESKNSGLSLEFYTEQSEKSVLEENGTCQSHFYACGKSLAPDPLGRKLHKIWVWIMIRVCMSLGMHESWVSSRRTNGYHVTPEIKSANDGFYLHCFPAGFLLISNYSPRENLPGWLYCVPPSRTVSVSSKKWKQYSRTVLVWCQLRVYYWKGRLSRF